MKEHRKEFGFVFWIHLAFILLAFSSFLYLDWRIVFVSVILLKTYHALRGGCDLTLIEFGHGNDTIFVWHYLKKIFPNLSKKTTKFYMGVIIPIALIVISFVSQQIFGYTPPIRLK